MIIDIQPFEKIGLFTKNTDYSEVISNFPEHQDFKKSPMSQFVTSSIMDGSMHVFYSEQGKCVGVEVFRPLCPVWKSIDFFSKSLCAIQLEIAKENIVSEIVDYGLEIPSLGVSLYSHDFDDSLDCLVDSVYISFLKKKY